MTWRQHFRPGSLPVGVLALLLTVGCDSGAPSPVPVSGQRGAIDPRASHGAAPSGLPVPGQRDPNRARTPPLPRTVGGAPRPAAPAAPAAAPAASAGAQTVPDYGNALRLAFGTPTSCISPETRGQLQGALRVRVSVRATPSGRVTSATVSAPGLSSEDSACMTERAENLRLGSIEGAPRTISATIEYNIASTPGTREPSSTSLSMRPQPAGEGEREWENRPGAQLPGTVLPAGGTAGRPAGSVAPSSTLSAGGTSERPPGFVPPSSALPASN